MLVELVHYWKCLTFCIGQLRKIVRAVYVSNQTWVGASELIEKRINLGFSFNNKIDALGVSKLPHTYPSHNNSNQDYDSLHRGEDYSCYLHLTLPFNGDLLQQRSTELVSALKRLAHQTTLVGKPPVSFRYWRSSSYDGSPRRVLGFGTNKPRVRNLDARAIWPGGNDGSLQRPDTAADSQLIPGVFDLNWASALPEKRKVMRSKPHSCAIV